MPVALDALHSHAFSVGALNGMSDFALTTCAEPPPEQVLVFNVIRRAKKRHVVAFIFKGALQIVVLFVLPDWGIDHRSGTRDSGCQTYKTDRKHAGPKEVPSFTLKQ